MDRGKNGSARHSLVDGRGVPLSLVVVGANRHDVTQVAAVLGGKVVGQLDCEDAVDKAHTDIAFTVIHLGVSKTRGSFTDFDGTIVADGKKPENSSVSFTIKTASVNTGNTQRDDHLRSKDFFNAEKYPEITFKSTKIAKRKGGFIADGNLTMHGVTKTVRLPFTVAGPAKGFKNELHLGVDTALTLSRKEYGLTWPAPVEASGAVGDTISVTISMELTK